MKSILAVLCLTLMAPAAFANIGVNDIKSHVQPDHTVQFRKGHYIYTLIPLKDMWENGEQKKSFEIAEKFAAKLVSNWQVRVLQILDGNIGDSNGQQKPMAFDKDKFAAIEKKLSSGQPVTVGSAEDIIRAAESQADAQKKLEAMKKLEVDYDKVLTAYQGMRDDLGLKVDPQFANLGVPDAYIFFAGGKFPTRITDLIAEMPRLKVLAPLTLGSVTLTVTVQPWEVQELDLSTGKSREFEYAQKSLQLWYAKDMKMGGLQTADTNFRIGAGMLWGDLQTKDVDGAFTGVSRSFNSLMGRPFFFPTSAKGPLRFMVKAGVIGPEVSQLVQGDLGHKIFYFKAGWQFGISENTSKLPFHANVGYVTQFKELAGLLKNDNPSDLAKKAISRPLP